MGKLRASQRQEEIVALLASDGTVSVDALARRFEISVWTIRRDLQKLEARGVLKRHYGRAQVAESADEEPVWSADSLRVSRELNRAAKARIGLAAAGFIPPQANVAISGGSTTLEVARALKDLRFCGELVTNALDIALELAECPDLRVVCTGGDVQGRYRTLAGAVTERVLKLHFFEVAVIGVSGLGVRQGLTVNSQVEAATLGLMAAHAQRVIIVADQSKFGRVAFASLPIDAPVQALVTDAPPRREFDEYLRERQIPVVVV